MLRSCLRHVMIFRYGCLNFLMMQLTVRSVRHLVMLTGEDLHNGLSVLTWHLHSVVVFCICLLATSDCHVKPYLYFFSTCNVNYLCCVGQLC
jgi:hypothetical protein